MTKDPHDILELSPEATEGEIKKAYKRLSRKYHPDHGGNPEIFKELNDAYETLMKQFVSIEEQTIEYLKHILHSRGSRKIPVDAFISQTIKNDKHQISSTLKSLKEQRADKHRELTELGDIPFCNIIQECLSEDIDKIQYLIKEGEKKIKIIESLSKHFPSTIHPKQTSEDLMAMLSLMEELKRSQSAKSTS